jgi:hypothetical protein
MKNGKHPKSKLTQAIEQAPDCMVHAGLGPRRTRWWVLSMKQIKLLFNKLKRL